MSKFWNVVLIVFVALSIQAQMPHEVLLLVNTNSQPSLKVANTFAALRQIPKKNIVYLDVPAMAYEGRSMVTPKMFTDLIWTPANAVAKDRGIDQQILAWVYSVDFPIRVRTDSHDRKQMSVSGLTFMRNRIPGLSLVEEGKYHSRIFAGPNQRLNLNVKSLTLNAYRHGLGEDAQVPAEVTYLKRGLGEEMPLPNMMLGYIGEKGNDVETVIASLMRGKQSDFRGQRDSIFFVTNDDVRSKCRAWQYEPVVAELQQRGITAQVITNFPPTAERVMGVMMGAEEVDPSLIPAFAPGAMAEHLTSWSAEFQRPQTKMTEWIKAGATASAGAVVEPYSNPNKFPSARFYAHYANGCTMLESFYQSIACPLQVLLLGDPMAKPYSLPMGASILGANKISSNFTYITQCVSQLKDPEYLHAFLLDGKEIRGMSDDPSLFVLARKLSDGYHELRAVTQLKAVPQFNASADKGFVVDRMGRSIEIKRNMSRIDTYTHGIQVAVGGEEMPVKLTLFCGELILDELDYSSDAILKMNERRIGEGPNRIRVVGTYADGMDVSSKPFNFAITFSE